MPTAPEWQALSDVARVWVGKGYTPWPRHDVDRVREHLGESAVALIPQVDRLEKEFYESTARITAPDLRSMGPMAERDFLERYPGAPDALVQALSWSYTFDFK